MWLERLVGSVCHTDAAKAYKHLSSPLHDGSLTKGDLCLSHTCVKHKPPHPEFSKRMKVRVWVGDRFEEQVRVGGTQKVDGFFAAFRQVVGRRPFNTVGSFDETRKAPAWTTSCACRSVCSCLNSGLADKTCLQCLVSCASLKEAQAV